MTKPANGQLKALGHWLRISFSFVIRHLSFLLLPALGCSAERPPVSPLLDEQHAERFRPDMPGGKVDIWYLEAFCRSGSTAARLAPTTIPHRTKLVSADQPASDSVTHVG